MCSKDENFKLLRTLDELVPNHGINVPLFERLYPSECHISLVGLKSYLPQSRGECSSRTERCRLDHLDGLYHVNKVTNHSLMLPCSFSLVISVQYDG
jgi:hypothetical protein